jgi:hypothetical protein
MLHSHSQTSSKPRFSLPWLLAPRKNYSATEVRQRLQVDRDGDARTQAVHAAAEMTSIWSSLLPERTMYDLGRTAGRLPTVVHWYRQGLSEREIGRRLSPFGTEWDAERALEAATELIARALND